MSHRSLTDVQWAITTLENRHALAAEKERARDLLLCFLAERELKRTKDDIEKIIDSSLSPTAGGI